MEFRRVDAPVFFPAACFCGNQKGPLVDTLVETLNGRLYLCSRCVALAAVGLGWTWPAEVEELSAKLGELSVRLEETVAELESARASKVLSFDDAKRLLDGRRNREPKATA